MRNMSFSMTTEQIMDRTKTVTRRFGWWFLKPGDRVRAVKKAMGLKRGERMEPLGVIEIIAVRGEPLYEITKEDCIKEGFPHMMPCDFVEMLCKHYRVENDNKINRIEFKYISSSMTI